MMEAVFLKVLNMGLTAGWAIAAVCVLRLALRRAPRQAAVCLWGLAAVRLVCPLSWESALSLIPSAQPIPPDILSAAAPAVHSGSGAVNAAVNPILAASLAPRAGDSANPMQIAVFAASLLWLAGMAAMAAWGIGSWIKIRRTVREAVPLEGNIWLCDHVDTPFILGIFRPRIYLPSHLEAQDAAYVLAHERAHLKRGDHWWKALGFLLLAVYWFQPLLWLGCWLFSRDLEFACDETVIRALGPEGKKPYSHALINCSAPRRMSAACPLAFGEAGVKARVKSVLNYQKPAFWVVLCAAAACTAAAVCLLTDPPADPPPPGTAGETPAGGEAESRRELGLPANEPGETPLTREAVIALSQKGGALRWSDLDGYIYTETGSGLYIRAYEIDDMFTLLVGGPGPNQAAWHFHLMAGDGSDRCIDIREESAADFILAHRDNPPVRQVSRSWAACPVDQTGENAGRVLEAGGRVFPSAPGGLPAVWISSPEELRRFAEQLEGSLDFGAAPEGGRSFSEVCREYDAAYFSRSALFLVYAPSGAGCGGLGVSYAHTCQGVLSMGIEGAEPSGGAGKQGWLLCIGVPKAQLDGVTAADVRAGPAPPPPDGGTGPALLCRYVLEEAPDAVKPAISLYDDGSFTFAFSPISSYMGYGRYREEGRRLTLVTEDGKYCFCFFMEEAALVFDGDSSTGAPQHFGIQDGAGCR